eukprot:NODE_7_length_48057_cov_0.322240.p21 type:complete len:188 gc:universal NODE_7_length_48057_cov_0.322240:2646-2083(-)
MSISRSIICAAECLYKYCACNVLGCVAAYCFCASNFKLLKMAMKSGVKPIHLLSSLLLLLNHRAYDSVVFGRLFTFSTRSSKNLIAMLIRKKYENGRRALSICGTGEGNVSGRRLLPVSFTTTSETSSAINNTMLIVSSMAICFLTVLLYWNIVFTLFSSTKYIVISTPHATIVVTAEVITKKGHNE